MNRITLASLAVAAVVGTTSGAVLALRSGGEEPSTTDRSTSAATGSPDTADPAAPSGSADPQSGVFYYADGAIHDGDRSVVVPTDVASGQVVSLQRVRDGWLVVTVDDDGETQTGTYVSVDDAPWRIGQWRGTWDLGAERDRVVFQAGLDWRVAVFADRRTRPLDVIDGPGKEPDFMTTGLPVSGVAFSSTGVITGWEVDGGTQLVDTDVDTWTHATLGRPGLDVPLTSADGSQVVASYPNPDYAPDNPVGECLAGGSIADVASWWEECQVGPASRDPWSPDGSRLLVMGTSNDGPGTSWLRVVDPLTGKPSSEFDPGGLLVGAEWIDDDTVDTLSYLDDESAPTVQRCEVDTEECRRIIRLDGNVVLGSGA